MLPLLKHDASENTFENYHLSKLQIEGHKSEQPYFYYYDY